MAVVRKLVSSTLTLKAKSQKLVYKFGNISSEILSRSVRVFFTEVSKQNDVQIYINYNSRLN
jgi:hypothetical protein